MNSISLGAVLVYLYMMRETIGVQMMSFFIVEPNDAAADFAVQLQNKAQIIYQLLLKIILPIFVLVIALAVFGGMIISGGPVFSFEPIAPKFEKINPAAGFKKIFGRRALITFLMHILRLTIMSSVLGFLLVGGWGALMTAPACGFSCVVATMEANMFPLVLATAGLTAVAAIVDFMVQRSEFLREQKMSITEFKREIKDQEGDPMMNAERKSEGRRMVETPTGAKQVVVFISDAPNVVVGIRYVEDETPAPLLVAKAKGSDGCKKLLAASKALDVRDADLAVTIGKLGVGKYVTDEETVKRLAPHIHRAIREA